MRRRGKGDGSIWKRLVNETTGKIAEIRLNKFGTFSCTIGDDRKESKTADDVETWADKIIAIVDKPVEWIPVIEVTATADRYSYRSRGELKASLEVGADRYWIARSNTGQWRIVSEWAKLDPKSPGRLEWDEALKESRAWDEGNSIENPSQEEYSRTRGRKPRPFRLPHQISEGRVVMKFDAALWAGVQRLVKTIERELETIRELMATEEGQERLREIATGQAQFAIAAESESTRAAKAKRKS